MTYFKAAYRVKQQAWIGKIFHQMCRNTGTVEIENIGSAESLIDIAKKFKEMQAKIDELSDYKDAAESGKKLEQRQYSRIFDKSQNDSKRRP